jgi:hypothetical protein
MLNVVCVIIKAGSSMPRAPCSFRESEIRRAIKAAGSAGIEIARIEIHKNGGFSIIPGKPDEGGNVGASNPWDEVLTNAADKERTA